MKVHRRTDFFGHECSDLGVDGWVSCNLNIVRICKSVRIIGRSLIEKFIKINCKKICMTLLVAYIFFQNHHPPKSLTKVQMKGQEWYRSTWKKNQVETPTSSYKLLLSSSVVMTSKEGNSSISGVTVEGAGSDICKNICNNLKDEEQKIVCLPRYMLILFPFPVLPLF